MQIKFYSTQKKTEMAIFKSKQKKFEVDLKIELCGKWLYPTESFKYLDVKTDTNQVGNIMLTICPLNWIEQMVSFSKWGNMLVLKYQDPSILLFLTPTYPTAVFSGLRIVVLFNKLWFYKKDQLELLIANQGIGFIFKNEIWENFSGGLIFLNG